MRCPIGKPLEAKSRAAHSVKRWYDVLIDSTNGRPARVDNPRGCWRRVVGKDRDPDKEIIRLTFADETTLLVRDKDTLYSRRVDDPEADLKRPEGTEQE